MDDAYLGQTTDIILGQEFLTWLWFCSETAPMGFTDAKGQAFTVYMEQRIVVQGGEGETLETASVSGAFSPLREVRLGLSTGKKVTRALVRFEQDDLTWQVTLKAEDFALAGLRTPKIEHEKDDDPDALFLEKMYLIQRCLDLFDATYAMFLALRVSSAAWAEQVQAMGQWMAPAE